MEMDGLSQATHDCEILARSHCLQERLLEYKSEDWRIDTLQASLGKCMAIFLDKLVLVSWVLGQ